VWIIPYNLPYYPFALDTQESNSALKKQLEKSIHSLMWRSKPTRLQTWFQRWKTIPWFQQLSGRILHHSLQKCFEEKLILYLDAIPARAFQPLDTIRQEETPSTYGLTLGGQLTLFGQQSAFWFGNSLRARIFIMDSWLIRLASEKEKVLALIKSTTCIFCFLERL